MTLISIIEQYGLFFLKTKTGSEFDHFVWKQKEEIVKFEIS